MPTHESHRIIKISLSQLRRSPYQPRTQAIQKKDLAELISSLGAVGQTTPIVVQPITETDTAGPFYVHQGERRWVAASQLGWESIDAIVKFDLDERSARRIALADNLGREDLTAWDQAKALSDYAAAAQQTFEHSAGELGLSRATAYRLKCIASASEGLREVFASTCVGVRAGDILVRMEAKDPRRALRLATKHAAGDLTLAQLTKEANQSRALLQTAVRKAIDFAQDEQQVRLRMTLRRSMVTDETRQEILNTVAQMFAALDLSPEALTINASLK